MTTLTISPETATEEAALELVPTEPAVTPAQARKGLRILQAELTLQRQHRKMLSDQNRALLACERDKFSRNQAAFPALLVQLQAQAAQRTECFGTEPVMDSVRHWPQPEQMRGEALATELHTLLQEISTLNQQNQAMIGNELKYFDFMIDLLVTAHRQCVLYAANGASAANRGNLFLNRVA